MLGTLHNAVLISLSLFFNQKHTHTIYDMTQYYVLYCMATVLSQALSTLGPLKKKTLKTYQDLRDL